LLAFLASSSRQQESDDIELLGASRESSKKSKKHLKTKKTKEPKAKYFKDQLVDHSDENSTTWTNRYYEIDDHWKGAGHPIFLMNGGEDTLDGVFFPFVYDHLAKEFGALSLFLEHRFYGESQPVHVKENSDMVGLMTVDNALADAIRFLEYKLTEHKCSKDPTSKQYCPVITVGASYPGFMAALLRILYPDLVDIGYASSAPLYLYTLDVDKNAYYDKVSEVAEKYSPGCTAATKTVLTEFIELVAVSPSSVEDTARDFHICVDTLPEYIQDNALLGQELLQTIQTSYADFNMEFYPPSDSSRLVRSCELWKSEHIGVVDKIRGFWKLLQDAFDYESDHKNCFDLSTFLPAGPNATLTTADWSGAGAGTDGRAWEYQTCYDIMIQTGFGPESMFVPRDWTFEALNEHCMSRFGQPIDPGHLVRKYGYDDLLGLNASRIIFTNGLNDGWSVFSVTETLDPSLPVVNFPNGAHHSELSQVVEHTDDITYGHTVVNTIMNQWLYEIKQEQTKK
jgi:hypothetical protein